MQTFLPHRSFEKSARCLDNKRLGNQRREAKTLLLALTEGNGWKNHPAAKMWAGHEGSLVEYGIAICKEWIRRGFNDSTLPFFRAEGKKLPKKSFSPPEWLGKKRFHSAHRSNLLRKDKEWYGQWGWEEDDSLPYHWPNRKEQKR